MKICHLCLNGPYNEGWNYQENIIPKYHARQGHDVHQIVTPFELNGNDMAISKDKHYINEYGVKIYRCDYHKWILNNRRLYRYPEAVELLNKINPDILFIHDIQCLDIDKVVKYLKDRRDNKCVVYVDNHSDYSNSARNWISKRVLHGIVWKCRAHMIEPYVKKFYGVTPARVDFLLEMYRLPQDKCELLLMGADDEIVQKAITKDAILNTRKEIGINNNELLIVTGGKINSNRPETIDLMKAIIELDISNLKLVIFGVVSEELKIEFDKLCNSRCIEYVGWQESIKTYYLMAAADLVVFPGLHSVMWEQAVALGVPTIFREIEGFNHVDVGGNAVFIKDPTKENLKSIIRQTILDKTKLINMKKIAVEKGIKTFSYNEIAKKSIEYKGEE